MRSRDWLILFCRLNVFILWTINFIFIIWFHNGKLQEPW
jgi:hypothetical protein